MKKVQSCPLAFGRLLTFLENGSADFDGTSLEAQKYCPLSLCRRRKKVMWDFRRKSEKCENFHIKKNYFPCQSQPMTPVPMSFHHKIRLVSAVNLDIGTPYKSIKGKKLCNVENCLSVLWSCKTWPTTKGHYNQTINLTNVVSGAFERYDLVRHSDKKTDCPKM